MLQSLSTTFNVLLMIVGFGLVIVVHEFGHFAAARWAGVRVHTFAVGFGTAICTWRKGLGFRWGSSEKEYFRRLARDSHPEPGTRNTEPVPSPTEYRLNWFPFGGYVKMLGQEDLSPIPSLTASDSFAAKPVWKRMVIMSGGVAMNLVLAGVLFIVAYSYGIKEVAPIVGDVGPGTPAQIAGLRAGDRVISINGDEATTFNDLRLAAAMGSPKSPIKITVARDGEAEPITLEVTPRRGPDGMLQIGVAPAPAATLVPENELGDPALRAEYLRQLQDAGLGSVQPGMRLVSADGTAIPTDGTTPHNTPTANPLRAALESSNGAPVAAVFAGADNHQVEVSLTPQPELQTAQVKVGEEDYPARHLLGLVPVMRVASTTERAAKAGLRPGDVFARIGPVEWPSIAAGIAQVRAHKGKSLDLVVLRDGALISLTADVSRGGQIGFLTGDTSNTDTLIGFAKGLAPIARAPSDDAKSALITSADSSPFPASRLTPGLLPGSRIRAVAGTPVSNFRELREALKSATAAALAKNEPASVALTLELPIKDLSGAPRTEEIALPLANADIASLHALGWDGTQPILCFELAQFLDQATGPLDALNKGVAKTHYVVMMTYVTFLRLFQGTVPVDQLHGPVGITHIGSQVAERGLIYLIFFLGLISANLAVINFLPLPIVDGGHMVFLFIEWVTRKPVSAAVQNTAIIAGLLLVGTVFVVVTFNDLVRLFG
jgi:regulator of sigma E protease